jgi:hypothetical protein
MSEWAMWSHLPVIGQKLRLKESIKGTKPAEEFTEPSRAFIGRALAAGKDRKEVEAHVRESQQRVKMTNFQEAMIPTYELVEIVDITEKKKEPGQKVTNADRTFKVRSENGFEADIPQENTQPFTQVELLELERSRAKPKQSKKH